VSHRRCRRRAQALSGKASVESDNRYAHVAPRQIWRIAVRKNEEDERAFTAMRRRNNANACTRIVHRHDSKDDRKEKQNGMAA
jgi:hypothetical protein